MDQHLIVVTRAHAARFLEYNENTGLIRNIDTLVYSPAKPTDNKRLGLLHYKKHPEQNKIFPFRSFTSSNLCSFRFVRNLAKEIESQRRLGHYKQVIIIAPAQMLYAVHTQLKERTRRHISALLFSGLFNASFMQIKAYIAPYLSPASDTHALVQHAITSRISMDIHPSIDYGI